MRHALHFALLRSFFPYLAAIVAGFSLCSLASATLQAPGISLDTADLSAGRFRVDFDLPEGVDLGPSAYYLQIIVDDGSNQWSFASLETHESFASQVAGERHISARICHSDRNRRSECGPASETATVQIPQTITEKPPAPPAGQPRSAGGPELTHPGSFRSTKTKWNSWQLIWLNDLVQTQPNGSDGAPFFELLVRWLTYEWDFLQGRYIPIWIWAQLESDGNSSTYSGTLKFRRLEEGSQVDYNIGEVYITPNPSDPNEVSVSWRTERFGMYATQPVNTFVSDTLEVPYDIVPNNPQAQHDHYEGDWTPLAPSGENDLTASMVVWIENYLETLLFLFFDDDGQPVWARADWHDSDTAPPTTGREEFCAYTVFDAIAPDTAPVSGHSPTVDWLGADCDEDSLVGANVSRHYDPVGPGRGRTGGVWADLQLPPSRPGRLQLGSPVSPRTMKKLSHFHDIRPVIDGVDGATRCEVEPGQSCTLDLRWVLEGIYPQASVFRKNISDGTFVPILTSIPGSEPGRSHTLPPGTEAYEFQIRRSNSIESELLARTHPIEVSVATATQPPDPVPDPNFVADPETNRTGATRGEFQVTEGGSSAYRIPIMTAPSGGGMAPEVSLAYDSQAGNGVAGLGWRLTGASAITRCSKTLETDGLSGGVDLTSNDRFCLDGQRFVQVSGGSYGGNGTEYRLEIDQIVRVRSFGNHAGGPAYFKVWRKDGTISWYGAIDRSGSQTGNSRVASKTQSGATWSWNIGRIEDSAGNFMQFIWQDLDASGSGVETVLARLDYSGHVDGDTVLPVLNRISFEYEYRPPTDRAESYVAGAVLKRHHRLTRIVSRAAGGKELRRYNLGYLAAGDGTGRSVLRQVTECNEAHCFSPTVFDWHLGAYRLSELSSSAEASFTLPSGLASKLVSQLPADLNGDGLSDLVFLFKNGSNNPPILKWRLANRNASGAISFGPLIDGPALGGGVRSGDDELPELRVIDIDADGYQDIVYAANHSTNAAISTFQLHRWNATTSGAPLEETLEAAVQIGAPETDNVKNLSVLDWNGDGLSDIAYVGGDNADSFRVARNAGFSASQPADTLAAPANFTFDLLNEHYPISPGNFVFAPQFELINAEVIDANGDGLADLIMTVSGVDTGLESSESPTPGSTITTQARHILFRTQFDEGEYRLVSTDVLARTENDDFGGGFPKARDLRLADLNADGRIDALYYNPVGQRWERRLGDGSGRFGPVTQITQSNWPTESGITKHLQLVDINGDGQPDALFPSAASSGGAVWRVSYWDWSRNAPGQGNYSPLVSTGAAAGNMGNGAGSLFVDFNGSGKSDQLLILPSSGNLKYLFGAGIRSGEGAFSPGFVVRRITDGFGAWTDLEYKPLTDPAIYRRGTNGAQSTLGGSTIYDIVPPVYVVASATSLSPQYELNSNATDSTYHAGGTTQVEYFYAQARIAGGGRGFLGFREVASYDRQSGMLTRTRYHQEFPLIGAPEATRRWFVSDDPWLTTGTPDLPNWVEAGCGTFNPSSWHGDGETFLGCSENTWAERNTTAGLTHPYLARSVEWSFNPRYSSSGIDHADFTHRVVTENRNVDAYGNVGQVVSWTYASINGVGDKVKRVNTWNRFNDDPQRWHLGRLDCSTVVTNRGTESETRRSTFDYDENTGILTRETVNASSCDDADGSLRKTYWFDKFGNRQATVVRGDGIDPLRKSRQLWDNRGRFVVTEQVWLEADWLTTREVQLRDRYGNATQVRDAQGVISTAGFDAMGRPHYRYSPDGAWTRVLHRTGHHQYCPSGTASREVTIASDGSRTWVCKDKLGRETRTIVWGFGGERIYTDTRYDYASRPIEVSEPYKAGQSTYFTRTVFDEIGRVESVRTPDPINGNPLQTWAYSVVGSGVDRGIRTSHLNAGAQLHRTDRNALGEKISETAADGGVTTYRYDALGQLTETDGPLPDWVANDKIEIEYDDLGHKLWVDDPDKGLWRYRHNALGELTCQIDAKGQGTEIVYDELGRRTVRRDRTGVSDIASCLGTTRGTTSWSYGATPQTNSFGQVTFESSQYNDAAGANHTTTRSYTYDDLGRLERVDTTIAEAGGFNRSYVERTSYDQFGRVFQQFDAAGGNRGTRFRYNDYGYLYELQEARGGDFGQVYWTVLDQDVRGQTTQAEFGNGIEMNAVYEPATGRLVSKTETNPAGALVQDLETAWDAMGNLKVRHDRGGLRDQFEGFFYDPRDRLTRTERRIDSGPVEIVQRQRYDQSGNIRCKSDVSSVACTQGSADNYAYDSTRPHAVTQAGTREFYYDANGNVTHDRNNGSTDRTFAYTTYDKIRRVSRADRHIEFHYGADRSRTLRLERNGSQVTRRVHYVGNVEVVYNGAFPNPDEGEFRRAIGGVAIATYFKASGAERVRSIHTDHLGSTTAIADEYGWVETAQGFDAWGQRRNGEDWDEVWMQWTTGLTPPPWAQQMAEVTSRGYTGHEHVDEMGIIHMNGRIYDAHLGRFLQADPFVEDSTTLNRYTYVHNNPLAYTDPSGYFSIGKWFRTIASIAITAYAPGILTPFLGKFSALVASGGLAGFVATGSIEGALVGAFTGAVFHGIGQGFASLPSDSVLRGSFLGSRLSAGGLALKSVAHAATGGVLSTVQGGKFGHGFAAAGLTQFASGGIDLIPGEGVSPLRIAAAAVLGGTVSEISGGKFANGATSAAFAFAFSNMGSRPNGEMTAMDRRAQAASSHAYWREAIGLSHLEFDLQGIPYSPADGFSASLSLLPAPLSASAIVSFAGTDPSAWANWKANIGQAVFGRSSQYNQAVDLARASSQALGGSVMFAGHSLGGGLASAAAYATGASAITFNAAGLHSNYRTGAHGGIRAHYVRGDWLTTMQQMTPLPNAAGTSIPHPGSGGPFRRHALTSFP